MNPMSVGRDETSPAGRRAKQHVEGVRIPRDGTCRRLESPGRYGRPPFHALKGNVEPQERCVCRSRRHARLAGSFELRGAEQDAGWRSPHVERVVGGGEKRTPDGARAVTSGCERGGPKPMPALSTRRGTFERQLDRSWKLRAGFREGSLAEPACPLLCRGDGYR